MSLPRSLESGSPGHDIADLSLQHLVGTRSPAGLLARSAVETARDDKGVVRQANEVSALSFQGFQISEQGVDLVGIQHEFGHGLVAHLDAFGQGFRQMFDRIAVVKLPKGGGLRQPALVGETDRVTARAALFRNDLSSLRELPRQADAQRHAGEEKDDSTQSLSQGSFPLSPDISHWRGLRVFGRSAVSRRFRGRRDRRGLWRLVRMAMFPALWKVRRKAAAYAAALVNRAWARAHSACQG